MAEPASTVWRDFNTVGVPSSGAYKPEKRKVREWAESIEQLSAGYAVSYELRSELYADLAHDAGALGRVFGDGANNGVYKKAGASGAGSWSKIGDLPEFALDDGSIDDVKLADMAEATLKGRADGDGTGAPENLTATEVRTILNVANGATANDPDEELRDRSTHTGEQGTATITGLDTALTSLSANDEAIIARYAKASFAAARAARRQGFFVNGVLDMLPEPWAAYGFSRLLADYDGPVVRTRYLNDETYHDVEADPDGYVSMAGIAGEFIQFDDRRRLGTMYDVTGNGRDAATTTESEFQFFVYQGDGSIQRLGGASEMTIADSEDFTVGLNGMTVAVLVHPRTFLPTGTQRIWVIGTDPLSPGSFRAALDMDTSGKFVLQVRPFGQGYTTINGQVALYEDGWQAIIFTVNFVAGTASLWQNGVVANASPGTGALTDASAEILVMNNHNGNAAFQGPLASMALYRQAFSPLMVDTLGQAMLASAPNKAYQKRLARIAYITDLHCSPSKAMSDGRYFADAPAKIEQAVDYFNALEDPADIMIVGGDMIDGRGAAGDLEDLAIAKPLLEAFTGSRPNVYLLGNHDLGSTLTKQDVLDGIGTTRPAYGSIDFNGLHVVWLDSNFADDDDEAGYDVVGAVADAYIPPAQRAWLEEDLGATAFPVVIFCHHPIDDPSSPLSIRNPEAVRAVVERSGANVLGFITGHAHASQRRLYDGIPVYRIEALVDGLFSGGNNAWATIDVYENRIEIIGGANQRNENVLGK